MLSPQAASFGLVTSGAVPLDTLRPFPLKSTYPRAGEAGDRRRGRRLRHGRVGITRAGRHELSDTPD